MAQLSYETMPIHMGYIFISVIHVVISSIAKIKIFAISVFCQARM
jgi:hypothetical protein